MNVTITALGGKTFVHVSLSERNLLALLSGLGGPACGHWLSRSIGTNVQLRVVAQADGAHYGSRAIPAVLPLEGPQPDNGASLNGV
jgi:hypothetical protein